MNILTPKNMIFSFLLLTGIASMTQAALAAEPTNDASYHTIEVEGVDVFYREAGNPKNPTIVLLHGFPTSSHMFRNLIPALADQYHVIAPDYPGYGFSAMPTVDEFDYTFDNVAGLMDQFLDQLDINHYSLYLMDYGAPVGFRIAANAPDKVDALIIQNGNAYDEGLDNNFWEPIKEYWKDRNAVNQGLDNTWWKNVKDAYQQPEMANEDALRFLLTLGATQWQYTNGVPDVTAVSPDNWGHVQPLLDRDGNQAIQLQMFYSYGTNPALYPEWQAYFREHQPPTLIVWGQNDEIFPAAGAEPYKRDLDNLEYHLIDTGHFALETHGDEIAQLMSDFLRREVLDDQTAVDSLAAR